MRTVCWLGIFASASGIATAATISLVSTQANQMLCDSPGISQSYCGSRSGLANASASSTASDGYVAVSIAGGAYGMTQFAQAFASSFFSREYLFSNGSGAGMLCYDVALEGFHSGVPAGSRVEVRYNGNLYPVGGSGITVYSFRQTFEYGKPFQLQMAVDASNSWMGAGAESGTASVSARLLTMSVQDDPSYVPEPSAALMWVWGLVLLSFGLRRPGAKR